MNYYHLYNYTQRNQLLIPCFALCLVLLHSCANVQPPSGGPADKEGPFVDTSTIQSGITNFKQKSIDLHFSEYVDKSKVLESIIISPEAKLEFDFSWKTLTITFAEPLDSNATYALTLGTEYTDVHGNKPQQAHTLIFSTGTMLDSGVIRGKLYDNNPAGTYIFLYPLKNMNPDTLNYSTTKPKYRTQVGTNGMFEFRALSEGIFRIVAVRDEDKNGVYNETTDAFGTTNFDVASSKGAIQEIPLRINPLKDKIAPFMTEVRSKSNTKTEVLFNEPIDTTSITTASWLFTDSAGVMNATILATYVAPGNAKNVLLITSPFDSTVRTWKITCKNNGQSVKDTSGNAVPDSVNSMLFSASQERDTTTVILQTISLRDSTRNVSLKPTSQIIFNGAIKHDGIEQRLGLFKGNTRIESNITWHGDNIVSITPKDSLTGDTWYELRFRTSGITSVLGKPVNDTLYRNAFKTLDTRTFGIVKGIIKDSLATSKSYVIELKGKTTLIRTISKAGSFVFNDVPEGDYTVTIFGDDNGDGKYTAGNAKPYQHAERFVSLEKPITVKARWTIDDIKLELK